LKHGINVGAASHLTATAEIPSTSRHESAEESRPCCPADSDRAVFASLFLPSIYRVERRVTMNARPGAVFPHINTLKEWPEWTAWTVAKYPDMKDVLHRPEAGVGASYSWEGKSSAGHARDHAIEPDKGIGYQSRFRQWEVCLPGRHQPGAIRRIGERHWSNEGDLGWNPVSRFFGLFMDKMMGPDFEEGLRNLQKKLRRSRNLLQLRSAHIRSLPLRAPPYSSAMFTRANVRPWRARSSQALRGYGSRTVALCSAGSTGQTPNAERATVIVS